jgi:peptidyl-prolyl cis-trans isomerase B (cyclophilin B)
MTECRAGWPRSKWAHTWMLAGLIALGGCGDDSAQTAAERAAAATASEKTAPARTNTQTNTQSNTQTKSKTEAKTRTTPLTEGEIVAIAAIDEFIAQQEIDKGNDSWKTKLSKPPQVEFPGDKTYYWVLETNLGEIRVRLMPDVAPMHVSSTIYLTRLGFYDEILFHRVISGFMAQGGDPLGVGHGGPGYKYDGEFSSEVRHDKPGMLSMANAGPGTDGSQFFLTFVPTPHLDGKHTIFGEVVDGMDTVEALESRGSGSGKTKEPLIITTATIVVE